MVSRAKKERTRTLLMEVGLKVVEPSISGNRHVGNQHSLDACKKRSLVQIDGALTAIHFRREPILSFSNRRGSRGTAERERETIDALCLAGEKKAIKLTSSNE